jgi:hypothetical protein
MTPEQITLVQSSFERLAQQLPAMATRFYLELFRRDPSSGRCSPPTRTSRKPSSPKAHRDRAGHAAPRRTSHPHPRPHSAVRRLRGTDRRLPDHPATPSSPYSATASTPPTREAWTLAYNLVAETCSNARPGPSAANAAPGRAQMLAPEPGDLRAAARASDAIPAAQSRRSGHVRPEVGSRSVTGAGPWPVGKYPPAPGPTPASRANRPRSSG